MTYLEAIENCYCAFHHKFVLIKWTYIYIFCKYNTSKPVHIICFNIYRAEASKITFTNLGKLIILFHNRSISSNFIFSTYFTNAETLS